MQAGTVISLAAQRVLIASLLVFSSLCASYWTIIVHEDDVTHEFSRQIFESLSLEASELALDAVGVIAVAFVALGCMALILYMTEDSRRLAAAKR